MCRVTLAVVAATGLLVDSTAAQSMAFHDVSPASGRRQLSQGTRDGVAVEGGLRFSEVPAEESGLMVVHRSGARGAAKRFMIECVGAGLGLLDLDDDGDLDLYLVQGGGVGPEGRPVTSRASRDSLLLNDGGGRFTPGEDTAVAEGFGFGVSAGDVDDDGDEDLLVLQLGPNTLLVNDGHARFVAAEGAAGLAGGADDWSMGAAFGDVDRDGDLDAYVTNYLHHDLEHPMLAGEPCRWLGCEVPCGPKGLAAQPDRLLLNDGRGSFTAPDWSTGLEEARPAYAFQPILGDLDDDGDLDLFVANDSVPNGYHVNQGNDERGRVHFKEQGMRVGLALSGTGKEQAGMGVAVGDVDGDGREDLLMTNFSQEQNALFLNASRPGSGALFFDEAGRLGLGRPSYFDLGWGCNLFDADGDGDLDAFVANGHVYPHVDGCDASVTYAQADRLYEQVSPGVFACRAPGSAFAARHASRGSAAGDVDGDGDVDLVVGTLDGPVRLLRNESAPAPWLVLDLRPVAASVGARVSLELGERIHVTEVRRGTSFLGVEDRRPRVALAGGGASATARVRWSDGSEDTYVDLTPSSTVTLVKGEGRR